jgi:transketolase
MIQKCGGPITDLFAASVFTQKLLWNRDSRLPLNIIEKNMKLNPDQRHLRRRILEMSHEAHVSHLGSALSVVDIIAGIYATKKPDERFVLSAGHSAVALYAVLEKHGILHQPNLRDLNIHPDRNPAVGIDVSTGSLGQGLPIALGIALATPSKNVWVVSTDGEMAEGSMWESLRIASERGVGNLKLFINTNGFGAYDPIDCNSLPKRVETFGWSVNFADGHNQDDLHRAIRDVSKPSSIPTAVIVRTTSEQLPFLKGLDAHYYVMKNEDFVSALESLK